MKFSSPLESATLIQRYKRFLVDVTDEHKTFTLHCANTGRMTGCAEPGFKAFYSTSNNAKRKYAHSLELTQNRQGDMICVNTSLANKICSEAIIENRVAELCGYQSLRQEVKYGNQNSRIDILLEDDGKPPCYVEVKSVTLLETNGQGYFPDATTARGTKHLQELIEMKQQGFRAVLFFLVQHTGIKQVQAAAHIDSTYAKTLIEAEQAGVEVVCYNTQISTTEINLNKPVKYRSLSN